MEFVKERCNASNLTRYYCADALRDADAIIRWLSDIRAIEGFEISYILLRDLMNSAEEGSDTLRLSGDALIEKIQSEVRDRSIDVISFRGTFRDKPIVIGAKLSRFELFITLRLSNKADIETIEKELSL